MRQPRRPSRSKGESCPVDPNGSVTRWISQLKDGDRAAAPRPSGDPPTSTSPSSAWARKPTRGILAAEPPTRRSSLWPPSIASNSAPNSASCPSSRGATTLGSPLFIITVRKAADLAAPRGPPAGWAGRGGSAGEQAELELPSSSSARSRFPEFAALVADEYRRLLDCLGDEKLRAVAVWKMEGETNAAIAARLGLVESTIERKLKRIRHLWTREGISASDVTPTEEGNRWPSLGGQLEAMCDRFEATWKAGRRPSIEDHLDGVPEAHRAALFHELLVLELAYRRRAGERPTAEEYQRRFPEHVAVIETILRATPPPRGRVFAPG